MDTLVRNATLRFSRRVDDDYEPLNPTGEVLGRRKDGDHGGQVSFSRPTSYRDHDHVGLSTFSKPESYRNNRPGSRNMFAGAKSYRNQDNMMKSSFSYKRERARNRHIFLQSYKLDSMESARNSKTKKLKMVAVKVKYLLVSVLSFIRADSLRSCNSRSAISASLPTRVVSCC